MRDFNLIVTIAGRGFGKVLDVLRRLARVDRTGFFNVLVAKAGDPEALLDELVERGERDPGLRAGLARVIPVDSTFEFHSREEFEEKASEAARRLAPELAGKSFHVRLHRRGFKGKISTPEQEQRLDDLLLEELERAGDPGRISFDDPDAVVDVETVGSRAGIALVTREQMQRHPELLRPD